QAPAPVVAAAPTESASAPAAAAPKASAPAAVATGGDAAGMLESLMDDNPWALAGGAGLVALLAGFGIYRLTKRGRKDNRETSFLESRLQPDSFFGASGGQRIDTREAGAASSSMSYSLSQLDAIGDVDPVAEADVYLAYGRDLQAEEILKEAMRSSPDRLAIRTKMLEVYAKRRDTKGFELLAAQLFALTHGEGEDWAKAQEMGAEIDPENRLYQPGGAPQRVQGGTGSMDEPLGASTMPQSVLPSAPDFGRASEPPFIDKTSVDLDLDFAGKAAAPTPSPAAPQRGPAASGSRPGSIGDTFKLDPAPGRIKAADPLGAPPAPTGTNSRPMEFDLSSITLDLDAPPQRAAPAKAETASLRDSGFSDLELRLDSDEGEGEGDPIARKLELAEAFSQIGDIEGARELLQEVIAHSEGAVRAKAQSMLGGLN
ncbi:MAG: FimV/HubP family polar landmark protein, partial [Burkholderiaceae bacterium]